MVKITIFGQQSMARYIFTIDFKVQFVQVYSVIQNFKVFGRGLKITVTMLLVFLIISSTVSLAVAPITH